MARYCDTKSTTTMQKFGFKANFTKQQVHSTFAEYSLRIHRAMVTMLQYIGEECVAIAREQGTYKDRTGNLRNSIGYVLMRNGDIISQNFEARVASKVVDAANGKGVLEGQASAAELAKQVTRGYALIVVAGMHYAYYVETRGYDVLDSAERNAQQRVPILVKQLQKQIYKMS